MRGKVSAPQLESLTQRIGRDMFERMRDYAGGWFNRQALEEGLMGLLMQDPQLKVQAFRLIDVLPVIRNDAAAIARHLREYFCTASLTAGAGGAGHAPVDAETRSLSLRSIAGRLLNFRSDTSGWARFMAGAAWKVAISGARKFIAGSSAVEAVRTIRRLRAESLGFTIDVLGEAALSDAESLHYHETYLRLITDLPRHAALWPTVPQIDLADGVPLARVNVSVKLSALFSQFDAIDPAGTKRVVKERLRPLLRRGMEGGAHVHVDMEHYAFKDLTLEICREVFEEPEFRDYPHFGVVLQAYLKDTERDAQELIDWARRRGTPIWVRLVKGAYWDTETVVHDQQQWPWPVWAQKWQSDACYERLTRLLLENHRHIRTAFGSHNVRSLSHALALRELLDVPGEGFELQMLYGMGDSIKRAAVERGARVRIYTPYGELLPGMAYLIRRLLENTANESFLRASGGGEASVDELLRDPTEIGRRTAAPRPRLVQKREFDALIGEPFMNVPNVDFTREPNRQRMLAALRGVRESFGRDVPLVIGGRRVTTGQWKTSLNPSRPAEIVGRIAQADRAAAEQAVSAAAQAFDSWRRTPASERAELLVRLAERMEERRFELNALICLECGKPWREADGDVSEAIDFCNYYAREMRRMTENVRRRDLAGETNEYFYAPRGVVAVISPWNFPLAILTGMATAALVTGNTVILKPAAPASVICATLMELLEQVGMPPGVANYLPGPGAIIGEVLVGHPQVAMIAFTGSRDVGCRINRLAAAAPSAQPALKKVIAEMGGKNAIIVDDDADPDEAVKGVLHSAFGYAGQKCSAGSRCIVLEGIYERFVERLVEAGRALSVGAADDPGTFVPPVIDAAAAKTIREYVEIGKREARCALEIDVRGLIESSGGGYFVGPTIFAEVPEDARIAREEIFGPVLAVIRARDMDHAIRIFNSTDFALTGGIFSRSPANLARAREECECGNLYINRKITGALVDVQPFGGFKMSGIGSKAGGPDYLIQFCEPRTITENTLRRGFAPAEDVEAATA